MNDDQFKALCNTYGFAPSRALREMLDAVTKQAVIAERAACNKAVYEAWDDSGSPDAWRCVEAIRARGKERVND